MAHAPLKFAAYLTQTTKVIFMNKPTILLVDDCPIMCKFYALFLSKKYDAHTATDPVAALELIQNGFEPDLIVSDLNMPTLNGVALIASIREYLPTKPILVVSGNDGIGKRKSIEAGADMFLAKPFHPADLSMYIGQLLEGNSAKESLWERFFARA